MAIAAKSLDRSVPNNEIKKILIFRIFCFQKKIKKIVGIGNRESIDRKSEVGSRTDLGSRISDLGSRNSELGTRNSELGTRKSEIGNRKSELLGKSGIGNLESIANQSRELTQYREKIKIKGMKKRRH